ncbi:MAG TPA: glycerophosphodiester phosphodiesterase, partial [Chloroflexi bacterium]|nr:glycerophosphodiester phosphodiesterase [Chloroflexota bacterium]
MRKKLGTILLIAALALAMLAGLRFATAHPRPDKPYLTSDRPLVMAHRGAGLAPENTLVAFQKALDLGADVLELDVHATKDGEIVVIHDETVDRTTDGRGAVKDFTLEELKRLDAGYHFTPDGGVTYPYRGRGITI